MFARNSVLRGRAIAGSTRNSALALNDNALSSRRQVSIVLHAQRTGMLEKRLYRQRTPLRLPRTVVKRLEVRHSGARLFARNTLKNPKT